MSDTGQRCGDCSHFKPFDRSITHGRCALKTKTTVRRDSGSYCETFEPPEEQGPTCDVCKGVDGSGINGGEPCPECKGLASRVDELRGQVARLVVLCADAHKVLSDIDETGKAVRSEHEYVMRRLADIASPGGDRAWPHGDAFRAQCVELLHRSCENLSMRWTDVLTIWSAEMLRTGDDAFDTLKRISKGSL
jgi:hypothetical protein